MTSLPLNSSSAPAAAAASTSSAPAAGARGVGGHRRHSRGAPFHVRPRTATVILLLLVVACTSAVILSPRLARWESTTSSSSSSTAGQQGEREQQREQQEEGKEAAPWPTQGGKGEDEKSLDGNGLSEGRGAKDNQPAEGAVRAEESVSDERTLEDEPGDKGGERDEERGEDRGEEKEKDERRDEDEETDFTLAEVVADIGGAERTVIFASASEGYLDFLENWMMSVRKVGYGARVLFIAEDDAAYRYLKKRWPRQAVRIDVSDGAVVNRARRGQGRGHSSRQEEASNSSALTYGTGIYNELVDRRPLYFKALIELNVTFLYNDVDIVWLRDPFPFFKGDKYDMWVQEDARHLDPVSVHRRFPNGTATGAPILDGGHMLCTCFMFVRPTPASLLLVTKWSERIHEMARKLGRAVPNQVAFNHALNATFADVRVGVVPIPLFPSGYIYFPCKGDRYCRGNSWPRKVFLQLMKKRRQQPVMVHNNWLAGHGPKLERFKQFRLWFVPPPPNSTMAHAPGHLPSEDTMGNGVVISKAWEGGKAAQTDR